MRNGAKYKQYHKQVTSNLFKNMARLAFIFSIISLYKTIPDL